MSSTLKNDKEVRRIEGLIAALERIEDPNGKDEARSLLQAVLELHGAALAGITKIVSGSPDATALLETMARDEKVSAILLLHDLHPHGFDARVGGALDGIRASLGTQGIKVELIGAEVEGVRIKVSANWTRVRMSPVQIRHEIENAVFEMAPEIEHLDIEGLPDSEVHEIKFIPHAPRAGNGEAPS